MFEGSTSPTDELREYDIFDSSNWVMCPAHSDLSFFHPEAVHFKV
jgi:hypothetical protein